MACSLKKPVLSVFLVMAITLSSFVFCNSFLKTSAATTSDDYLATADNVKKPDNAGRLKIVKKDGKSFLAGEDSTPIQLRGMSTHGLQWYPEILNKNAFYALSYDWQCNVIRLAMYVSENGYATDKTIKDKVIKGIELAKDSNMYVIVDFHVLTPGDPNDAVYSGAKDFFKDISTRFPNDQNIIYELCNEPNTQVSNDKTGWQKVKDYAKPIIKMLRDSGNENIILVGSPNWSQRPDLCADDPINDSNTAYTVHFYSGTHETSESLSDRENVMSNTRYAVEHGACVFASEFGTSKADGTGGNYFDECDKWLSYLNEFNISWCNWALSNKAETSAVFMPYVSGVSNATSLDPGNDMKWENFELTDSGNYVRSRILGVPYVKLDRTKSYYENTAFDFDDGTTQGFDVNPDSPSKDVKVTNSDNRLLLSNLPTEGDVNKDAFWNFSRISADGASASNKINIKGAKKLKLNVYSDVPTTVAIAAVPQSNETGWASPKEAKVILPAEFLRINHLEYMATVVLTDEDAPNLKAIATSEKDNILSNIILFVGSKSAKISIDDIAFLGEGTNEVAPLINSDPIGKAVLPATFENSTRDGIGFDSASGVQGELKIADANSSKALSFDCTYPDKKPSDGWASAPRLIMPNINFTCGENDRLSFDVYLKPTRATKGNIQINLAFAPPDMGYWAQCDKTFTISLNDLSKAQLTKDGLYHFVATFDLTKLADGKSFKSDTVIRDLTIVLADDESDFSGKMFIDNIALSNSQSVPTKPAEVKPNNDKAVTPVANTGNKDKTNKAETEQKTPKTGDDNNIPVAVASVVLTIGLGILLAKKVVKPSKSKPINKK